MHKMQAPDGSTRLAYRDPSFVPGNYDAVLLEPMVYYPQPQATDEVSPGTLQDIPGRQTGPPRGLQPLIDQWTRQAAVEMRRIVGGK